MEVIKELVWVTQFGLSVISPLLICLLPAVFLRNRYSLGNWIVIVALVLGVGGTVMAFVRNLRDIARRDKPKKKQDPPIGFNEHQ